MSIQLLPTSLLYQIISNVPFPSRWETSLVCQSWYSICIDPYLYQDIFLEDMELKLVVKSLHWIVKTLPSISVRSLNLRRCYCDFLATTLVPLTTTSTTTTPVLYSQLRTLTPKRRRLTYLQHGFHTYDHLSTTLTRLLLGNAKKLRTVAITHCDLDWAMIQWYDILVTLGAGRSLTTWIYHDNYTNNDDDDDKGQAAAAAAAAGSACKSTDPILLPSGQHRQRLLAGLIKTCPEMTHFLDHDAVMDDTLLLTLAAHAWPHLTSLVLKGPRISAKAFGLFLQTGPRSLQTLVLNDLACLNDSLHGISSATVQQLIVTTLITRPWTACSLDRHICTLFPHLQTLTYATNPLCFAIHAHPPDTSWHALIQRQQQQQQPATPWAFQLQQCPPTMHQLLIHTSHQVMRNGF